MLDTIGPWPPRARGRFCPEGISVDGERCGPGRIIAEALDKEEDHNEDEDEDDEDADECEVSGDEGSEDDDEDEDGNEDRSEGNEGKVASQFAHRAPKHPCTE